MDLYIYNDETSETLYLVGGGNGAYLAPDGWIPSSSGTDTIGIVLDELTVEELDAFVDRVNKLLRQAEDQRAAKRKRVYMCHKPTEAIYTRRTAIDSGVANKRIWRDRALQAEHAGFSVNFQHERPELDQEIRLENRVKDFEYDPNGDSLASGWSQLGSVSARMLAATWPGMPGYRLQHVSGTNWIGVQSDNFDVTAGEVLEYFAHVWASEGDVKIRLFDAAGPTLIDDVVVSTPTTPTRGRGVATIPGGVTSAFIRIVSSLSTAATVRAARPYVGTQNLYDGEDWDHGMWCSFTELQNCSDWEWNNTGGQLEGPGPNQNSDNRETIFIDDLDAIGGETPEIHIELTVAEGPPDPVGMTMGMLCSDEATKAWFSLQAESGTLTNGAALATHADATGPAANNCVAVPATGTLQQFDEWLFRYTENLIELRGRLIQVIACIIETTFTDWDLVWGIGSKKYGSAVPPAIEFTESILSGQRYHLRGPVIYFPPVPASTPRKSDIRETYLNFWAKSLSGSKTFHFDRIILLPLDGYLRSDDQRPGTITWYNDLSFEGIHQIHASTDKALYRADDAEGYMDHFALYSQANIWLRYFHSWFDPWDGSFILKIRPRFPTL